MPSECDRNELREVSAAVLAVAARRSVREVLATILGAARRLIGARYAALGVPDTTGSFGEFLAEGIDAAQWDAIGPLPRHHGLLGVLLREPRPVRLDDVRDHQSYSGWPAAHPDMTDFLGVPIVHGDEILGELFLANKQPSGPFTAADEELLGLLAAHAAIAMVNARLYERSRELSIVEERNRIARELHDAVTQKLFSLRLSAEAAATLAGRDPARAAAELATVRQLAGEATDELRAVLVGLRPADLAGDGLDVALRKQVELLDRVHDAAVTFRGTPLPGLSETTRQSVYRIAQEALHNALRHAGAGHIDVALAATDGVVRLAVTDDGTGFDADSVTAAGHRLGLASMRERARAAGGHLAVTSRAGGGTTVRLEVPTDG